MFHDSVPQVSSGDRIEAAQWEAMRLALRRPTTGEGVTITPIGVSIAGPRGMEPPLEYCELKADLAPGATADAYRLQDDGAGGVERIDTDPPNETWEEATVRDVLGTTRGAGADDAAIPAIAGTYLLARPVGDEWHIVSAQGWPLTIRGALTADLATTDGTFKIDGVIVLNPVGAIDVKHLLDVNDEVTVYNIFEWEGDDNGVVIAVWNETNTRWEAIQVQCPA